MDTAAQIAAQAGEIFVQCVKDKPDALLGLATGASPIALYRYLVAQYKAGAVRFRNVRTYNLDEYCGLAADDSNSYAAFMREHLFRFLDIPPENTHIPNGCAPDIAAECKRYDALIEAIGGVDLQLLGIGTVGHIGFNEPSDRFADGTYKVKLHESTIAANSRYFQYGDMPQYAITMGVGTILKAKKIVVLATGAGKAKAVYDMLNGAVTPHCPASALQRHADTVVFLDKAAASLL